MLYRYYTEVKSRIFLLLISGISIFLVGYIFKEVILSIIVSSYSSSSSLEVSYFIFTDVVEVFNVYVCLIFFLGKQVLLFHMFYHSLLFIVPGLTKSEYRHFLLFSLASSFLFLVSVIMFKKFLFPFSWIFFLSFKNFVAFKSLTLHFEAKLLNYVMFFINLYFSCILYFQFFLLPIFLLIYFRKKLNLYKSYRKFLYYGCVIFSTLVTPPDIASQVVLSIALVIGCEILVYVALFNNLLNKKN
jgi:sec-independent protein translocase protein TatC